MTTAAMHPGIRRAALVSAFALLAVAGLVAYILSAVLSDDRSYSGSSLDYLILTPAVIKGMPLDHAQELQYSYSAADGPKPAVSTVEFIVTGDQNRTRAAIETYLRSRGLAEQSPGVYARKGQEVSVQPLPSDTAHPRIRVEVLDYLN